MKRLLLNIRDIAGKDLYIPLLFFLLIFTIDKIVLKFAGIALLFLLHPDFKFRRNIGRIPLFYMLLLMLEVVKFLLMNRDFSNGHTVTFLVGSLFWIISFLALHSFRSIAAEIGEARMFNTLRAFFLINAGISFLNILMAMIRSGSLNPYLMADTNFGNSTGDLIKGLFLGPSYINMMINSFFIFYFLYKDKTLMAFVAMIVALLTTTNFANLILIPVLIACFFFNKQRKVRFSIAAFCLLFVIFYAFASPNNFRYLRDSLFATKKQQQELIAYEKKAMIEEIKDSLESKMKAKPASPGNDLTYSSARVNDMLKADHSVIADSQVALIGKFGKVQSFKETGRYLLTSPGAFTFGAGMGCFSSFLALRMSGVNKEEGSRLFTYLPPYISPEFRKNHYQLFKTIYSLPREFHSAKHFPNSFVNQLFGEYGLAGALLFLFTYVLFFAKHFRRLTYGKYLLFLLGGFLLFDYLFEYLSVVSVFELLMLCDLRNVKENRSGEAAAPLQAQGA